MARKTLLLLLASSLLVTTMYGTSLAAPSQAQPGFLGVRILPGTGIVMAVYEGGPAERAGIRTADALTDVDGKLIASDKGGVPGTVEKINILRKGELPIPVEIRRVARTEINWGSGVFHVEKDKVWRALIAALAGPRLSDVFRVRQALKDEGVIFCDKSDALGFQGRALLRDDVVYPEQGIWDSDQILYAVWVTPTIRVRERSGATVVDVTLSIAYNRLWQGALSIFSGTARSAGGIEGWVFDRTFMELNR